MRRWELEAVTFLDLMMVMWLVHIAVFFKFYVGSFSNVAFLRYF